ncbi:putative F-box domain-containing protein [Medicago truncatula]|uniref:Putative F-box domain-containing protein n=1 Tax=Medicago truncatula TaxID=3880 RepID=A0A396JPM7_MEDTR|nr:putative F-box domain-containing protein [Medicago truncatula]
MEAEVHPPPYLIEAEDQPPYLPDELITQILLRLPVKSLIRFKCVHVEGSYFFTLIQTFTYGFSPSKDDYLVVSVSYIPNSDDVLSRLRIFSLRANVWNEIVSPTHLPCIEVPCSGSDYPVVESVFNGAIHWLAFRHEIDFFVAAFHLTERKLLEIPLPSDIEFWSTDYSLWVFRGFLSLWVLRFKDRVDIWVMKEYKGQSSWTKTLVLNMDTIPRISPICCTKSGDIVGTSCRIVLIRYDNEGEFLEHTYYCKCSTYVSIYTSLCFHSLVSVSKIEKMVQTRKQQEEQASYIFSLTVFWIFIIMLNYELDSDKQDERG